MWGKSQGKSLILCQLGITQRILLTLHPKSWKLKGLENEDRNIDGLQKTPEANVSGDCLLTLIS